MNTNVAGFAWRMPPMFTRECVALKLAMKALCDPANRLLNKDLVESKDFVKVHSYTHDCVDGGLAVLFAVANPLENILSKVPLVDSRLQHYRETGIDDRYLENSRTQELAQYHNVLVDWSLVHNVIVDAELQGDWQWALMRHAWVKDVSCEEMLNAFNKYIVGDNQSTVVLMPAENYSLPGFQVHNPPSFVQFPTIIPVVDAPAQSYEQLEEQLQWIDSDTQDAVALLSRRVSDGLVHARYQCKIGNDESRAPYFVTHLYSNALRQCGGNGLTQEYIESWFSHRNGFIDWRREGFTFHVLPEYFDEAFALAVGVFHNPSFTTEQFQAIKDEVISNYQSLLADPIAAVQENVVQHWNDYSYGHWSYCTPLNERLHDAQNWTYERACKDMAFLSERGRVELAVCGDVSNDQVRQAYSLHRAPRTQSYSAPVIAPVDLYRTVEGIDYVECGSSPAALVVGRLPLALKECDSAYAPLTLAVIALGAMLGSRLWQRLREKEGLAYSTQAGISWNYLAPRSFVVFHTSCTGETSEHALSCMQEEWSHFIASGITQKELDDAKIYYSQESMSELNNDQGYVSHLGSILATGRTFKEVSAQEQMVRRCSLDEVNHAIRTYLSQPVQWGVGRQVGV